MTLRQMHFTRNSFLFKTIITYLTRILSSQKLDQPSFLVSSTKKAARNINGTTLHFTFHLPVKNFTCNHELKYFTV